MQTKEYREQLAETFINVLEGKQLDWKKEWLGMGLHAPESAKTGKRYRGINQFYLSLVAMDRNYADPRWATFKYIKDNGWKLHDAKGQGVKVEYWYPYDREEKKSLTWEEFRQKREKLGERYFLKSSYSTVFNASLVEGIQPLPEPEAHDISPDTLVTKLSANMDVEILDDGGDRAFYRPAEDKIHLPLPEAFESDYAYASTALHELAHATGAKHRLNRDLSGLFGTPSYAFEELVAEISSCFMSANLQMEQSATHIDNHKAYVQSWISHIKEQPESLIKAVQQAEKTASYMEYKAELISQQEYDKGSQATMEVAEQSIIEPAITEAGERIVSTEDLQLLHAKGWDIHKDEYGYRFLWNGKSLYAEQENGVAGIISCIRRAAEVGESFGMTLGEIRKERGYSIEEFAGMVLSNETEITAIESGAVYPDNVTLQLIGNIYTLHVDDLVNGKIVPRKTRTELNEMIREIRNYIANIRNETSFLNEFMKKHGIETPKKPEAKEFFVIEDQVTGETIVNEAGEELRTASKEEAEKLAELLNRDVKNSADAKEIIYAYEQSIGRAKSVIGVLEESVLFDYAVSCKEYLRFGRDVERCLRQETMRRDAILVCQTPNIYIQAGCSPLPMHITQHHLRNCIHKKGTIDEQVQKRSEGHYHGMLLQEVKRISEELENPAVLGESMTKKGSLIALLGYKDQQGNPVLVSFMPSGKAGYALEVVESNFITSVYGRENAEGFIERLIEQNKILYINKNKSEELALMPLYLRQGHPALAFNTIIRQMDNNVNRSEKRIEEATSSVPEEDKTEIQDNRHNMQQHITPKI